jgi:subtilase family serine protease
MSAACSALVDVYQGYQSGSSGPGWYEVCGTSEAAPIFAGIIALADQVAGKGLGAINARLYRLAGQPGSGIVDVTSGNNTVSFAGPGGTRITVTGFNASKGYDLASGVGTIDAALFVPALAAAKP